MTNKAGDGAKRCVKCGASARHSSPGRGEVYCAKCGDKFGATCCQCGGRGFVDNPDQEEAAITGIGWMSCYHCGEMGKTLRDCCTGHSQSGDEQERAERKEAGK